MFQYFWKESSSKSFQILNPETYYWWKFHNNFIQWQWRWPLSRSQSCSWEPKKVSSIVEKWLSNTFIKNIFVLLFSRVIKKKKNLTQNPIKNKKNEINVDEINVPGGYENNETEQNENHSDAETRNKKRWNLICNFKEQNILQ